MLIASLDTKVYKKSCRWQVLDIADLVTARLTIEFRIECVEVLTVKFILNNSQTFTETLIMNNFTFTEESDWIADFRIFYQTQNIIIRSAGFLFCSHIFMQICNRITFGLECCSTPRSSAGSLRPECECVVYIIFVEAGFFNLFWCKITGKLMHNGTDDFKVSQFFGAWIVIDIAPFEKEICFKLKL